MGDVMTVLRPPRLLLSNDYFLVRIHADGVDGVVLEVSPIGTPDAVAAVFVETSRQWWPDYLRSCEPDRHTAIIGLWEELVSLSDVTHLTFMPAVTR